MRTKIIKIDPYNFDPKAIKEAAMILQKGGIVAFPTETVYGLAADYNNEDTINRLYDIKKRPKDKPFTIHIAKKEKITEYIDEPDQLTKRLIDKFWPGPLTIIVESKDGKALGFRMPSNRIALELINMSSLTIVGPSANVSGKQEPVEPFSVVEAFDGLIDMVIDAGPTEIGISSTVVDMTTLRPKILREGSNIDGVKAILHEGVRLLERNSHSQGLTPYGVIMNILIVCTGNSCRSPMAEGLLKRELEKEGFSIRSAGTMAVDGLVISPETVEVMKRYANVDMSGFLTHRLTKDLTDWADIILVMDRTQKDFIKETIPEAKEKVHLFKEYANMATDNPNIPDPIGKPFLAYEQSYRQIEEGANRIVKRLKEE
ncbi:MAG: threonylcarbamoyl-AMP synthase [Candidatus Omnitrophota bacterium]|nr:MAG: threonylcarbamoyl-AMP synthase [Candidatus Omnitrophota bacterium]